MFLVIFGRYNRVAIGATLGRPFDYGMAVLYPAIVVGGGVAIAFFAGAIHPESISTLPIRAIALTAIAGVLAALLTEEGFFRGAVWAAFERAGMHTWKIAAVTSIAFALWHLSHATLAVGYILPPQQVVIFILNACVIGFIWATMRAWSGSIVVTSVSHSVWNAVIYGLFGEGLRLGRSVSRRRKSSVRKLESSACF
ncbi:MAG: CPBP family intramembrane metalloprotease [Candidatus Eremiobacteraeota bacterium]|nr:CPBP family intramembrane metalloprotease [Candidatus Eremiobacteraeota bacterium]